MKVGMSGVRVRNYPEPTTLRDGCALRDGGCARLVCVWVVASSCRAAGMSAGDATVCAWWPPTSLGRESTKRFLFLILPRRRDCAKYVRESSSGFNII